MAKVLFFILIIASISLAQTTKTIYFDNEQAANQNNGTETNPYNTLDSLYNAISRASETRFHIKIQSTDKSYKRYLDTLADTNCVIRIPSKKIDYLKIEGVGGTAILDGENTKEYGIYINPTKSDSLIQNIEIINIDFYGIKGNGIKAKGLNKNFRASNLIIKNCTFEGSTDSVNRNTQNVVIHFIDNLTFDSNTLYTKAHNTLVESDGIYLDSVFNVTINNNYIETLNTYGTVNTTPHVDCIQTVDCKDVTITNNKLISKSDLSFYDHRSGIIMSGNMGSINIYNNIIKSFSNNLINADLYQSNSALKIYNNTLIGENQQLLIDIKSNLTFFNNIEVKNNILYKANSSTDTNNTTVILKFRDTNSTSFGTSDLSRIQNNNYFTTYGTPRILFEGTSTIYLNKVNPEIDATTLRVSRKSPVKNKGAFISTVSKDIYGRTRPYWQKNSYDIGAEELQDAQIRIGVVGFGSSDSTYITHKVQIFGSYWEHNNSLVISSNNSYKKDSIVTKGNTEDTVEYWKGFSYGWLREESDSNRSCGIGVYKISNSHNPNSYFYLDMRHWRNDADFNPNVNIRFDASPNVMKYAYYKNNDWQYINDNGIVIRIWDILNEQPNTAPLNNYWANALVLINSFTGLRTPRLIWGPHPQHSSITSYKFYHYRPIGAPPPPINWGSGTSISNSIFEWSNEDYLLGGGNDARYKVSASNTNLYQETNVVDTNWSGNFKVASLAKNNLEFSLSQNYPNPFNPSTVITFTNKNQEYVELRVYDVLGREIRTLLNQEMEPGEHKVTFDAGNLPSGIYFYNIKAGEFTQTHKMILIK